MTTCAATHAGGRGADLQSATSDLSFRQLAYDAVEMQSLVLELSGRPVFVGEWSLALSAGRAKTWVDGLGDEEKAQAYRTFFRNQADAMTRGRRAGGFFWTWNARGRVWGFSDLEKHGWIERSWWSAPNRTA